MWGESSPSTLTMSPPWTTWTTSSNSSANNSWTNRSSPFIPPLLPIRPLLSSSFFSFFLSFRRRGIKRNTQPSLPLYLCTFCYNYTRFCTRDKKEREKDDGSGFRSLWGLDVVLCYCIVSITEAINNSSSITKSSIAIAITIVCIHKLSVHFLRCCFFLVPFFFFVFRRRKKNFLFCCYFFFFYLIFVIFNFVNNNL